MTNLKGNVKERCIDFPEFLAFLARKTMNDSDEKQNVDNKETAKQLFYMFKSDDNEPEAATTSSQSSSKMGVITADKLYSILDELGEPYTKEQIQELINESSVFCKARASDTLGNSKDSRDPSSDKTKKLDYDISFEGFA